MPSERHPLWGNGHVSTTFLGLSYTEASMLEAERERCSRSCSWSLPSAATEHLGVSHHMLPAPTQPSGLLFVALDKVQQKQATSPCPVYTADHRIQEHSK